MTYYPISSSADHRALTKHRLAVANTESNSLNRSVGRVLDGIDKKTGSKHGKSKSDSERKLTLPSPYPIVAPQRFN